MQNQHPEQSDVRRRSRRKGDAAGQSRSASSGSPPDAFTDTEWRLIIAMRDCYDRGLDLLTPSELARMRFLKWLVDSGRLEP